MDLCRNEKEKDKNWLTEIRKLFNNAEWEQNQMQQIIILLVENVGNF